MALLLSDKHAIRHRSGASEWSAVEAADHMIDKMQHWARRVERILVHGLVHQLLDVQNVE